MTNKEKLCKTCIYGDKVEYDKPCVVYSDKCKLYEQKKPMTNEEAIWIPCSERLQEDYIHVLCQFTLGGMGECYIAHGVFHVVGGLVMTCNEVIAWMPLPEPYKAESEDQ